MAGQFAPQLGLIGFATVLLQAACSGAPFEPAMNTALAVMVGFYCLGWVIGEVARRVVDDCVRAEMARHQREAETQAMTKSS